MEERLQKYMARCGVDSRRKCEELIARGLVEVNGEVVREPGVKIDPRRDRVSVEGKRLRIEEPAHYLHYKVKGVTTTVSDDLGRRTVMDCLPNIRERVYPVGRLDKDSEGLLVLTNDGALANYLTHPAYGIEKTYRVVAEGRVEEDVLAQLAEKGMRLGPVLVKPTRVELVRYDNDNTVVLISVSEGINREVRRIFAALGHEVKKLLRTQIGPLSLAGLKHGGTRALTPKELKLLQKGMDGIPDVEVEAGYPPGSAGKRKPAGPRGRPKRQPAPRRGKPDPAAKPAGRTGGRDSEKKTPVPASGPGRGRPGSSGRNESARPVAGAPMRGGPARRASGRARAVGDEGPKVVARPGKPLRPAKAPKAGGAPAKGGKPAKSFKPAKKAGVGHPLAPKPPASGSRDKRAGKRK